MLSICLYAYNIIYTVLYIYTLDIIGYHLWAQFWVRLTNQASNPGSGSDPASKLMAAWFTSLCWLSCRRVHPLCIILENGIFIDGLVMMQQTYSNMVHFLFLSSLYHLVFAVFVGSIWMHCMQDVSRHTMIDPHKIDTHTHIIYIYTYTFYIGSLYTRSSHSHRRINGDLTGLLKVTPQQLVICPPEAPF